MPRALKVYRAHIGFFDTVVAAHSQKEALAAWGGTAAEFRQGFAAVTNDKKAVDAALSRPGVVLYRPFGSDQAFTQERTLPKVLPRTSPPERLSGREKERGKKSAGQKEKRNRDEAKKNARREKQERQRLAREESARRREEQKRERERKAQERARAKEELERALAQIDQEERELEERRADAKAAYAKLMKSAK